MVDLDGFKQLNDTHGHRAGDEALRQVTVLLREACRRSDVIIRWGGDEFLIVGRQTERRGGDVLAERIVRTVSGHGFVIDGGGTERLTCSIGYAVYPFVERDPVRLSWEQVLVLADRALYAAKAGGRNAWVGFEEGTQASSADLFEQASHDLSDVIERGLLKVQSSLGAGVSLASRVEH